MAQKSKRVGQGVAPGRGVTVTKGQETDPWMEEVGALVTGAGDAVVNRQHIELYARLRVAALHKASMLQADSKARLEAITALIGNLIIGPQSAEIPTAKDADVQSKEPDDDIRLAVDRRFRSMLRAQSNLDSSLRGLLRKIEATRTTAGRLENNLPAAWHGSVTGTLDEVFHKINLLILRIESSRGEFEELHKRGSVQEPFTAENQTLLWWYHYVPDYPERLEDMLLLGGKRCWHFVEAKNVNKLTERLKRLTNRLASETGLATLGIIDEAPPAWALRK